MKYLLFLALLLPVCLHAQQAEPLQEWYHIAPGDQIIVSGPLGFFPNFDTANNGFHATAMYVMKPTYSITELWYHRYVFDTVGQHPWLWGTRNVIQVDLDNNGVLDYFTSGNLIRGIQNGSPPEDSVYAYYLWLSGSRPYTITNLNDDEYPDIVQNLNSDGSGTLFSVLVGGPDLANLKYTTFRRRGPEYFIGLLNRRGEDGSFRVITMSYSDQNAWTSLVLSAMTTQMLGDSLLISLQALDSLSLNTLQTSRRFFESSTKLFHSTPDGKDYLLASEYDQQASTRYTVVYNLENDSLVEIQRFTTNNRSLHILDADINGDGYYDWAIRSGGTLLFYAGQREGVDTIPLGSYPLVCTDHVESLYAIGDVNNDKLNDMAYALEPASGIQGCFGIILGTARRTVGVPEPVTGYPASYRMEQNYPNPVGSDRKTTIPVYIENLQPMTLDLWTLGGQLVGRLFEGTLPEGGHDLHVSLDSYKLAAGLYVVRLTGNEGTIERAILLQ